MAYGLSSAPFDHERNSEEGRKEGRMEAGGRPEGKKGCCRREGGPYLTRPPTGCSNHDTVRTSERAARHFAEYRAYRGMCQMRYLM